jgi:tetratricopeptide (TPR) repeat protein
VNAAKQTFTEGDLAMRPKSKFATYLTVGVVLCCGIFPSASAPTLRAQDISRLPAKSRSGRQFPSLETDTLSVIQVQPAVQPRITPVAETVSIHDLLVPPHAVKEFQRSLKDARAGNFQSAVQHLQRAIQIEPKFVQAHNNLGASYLQMNEYESAVAEFRTAIDLDNKIQEAHRNLSLGLFLLRRYPEAEVAAREAVKLSPERIEGRYTLGRILSAEGTNGPEAEALLRQSISEFPDARLPLVKVLIDRGDAQHAADELRAYLNSPAAAGRRKQIAQCWLSQITQTKSDPGCSNIKADR